MEDYRITSAGDVGVAEREGTGVLGKVLGLVGFSFLFTAGGAAVSAALGPGIFWPSVIAAFGALLALQKLRERSPLNLGLLYAFATLEGLVVGPALDIYIARGLGGVILQAAAATATVTMAAGFFGATTRRDLSGWPGSWRAESGLRHSRHPQRAWERSLPRALQTLSRLKVPLRSSPRGLGGVGGRWPLPCCSGEASWPSPGRSRR